MTAKEYLEQARFLDMQINAKLRQLEELRGMVGAAAGSCSGKTDGIVWKIMAAEEEINKEIDKLVDLKTEIRSLISQIPKPEYRTILELRYLCFFTWENIEVEMNYSRAYLFRLHNRALEEFGRLKEETKGD